MKTTLIAYIALIAVAVGIHAAKQNPNPPFGLEIHSNKGNGKLLHRKLMLYRGSTVTLLEGYIKIVERDGLVTELPYDRSTDMIIMANDDQN
jgi:hypothetical protein